MLYGPGKGQLYRTFEILKRNGEPRQIHAPVRPLKFVQRQLAATLYEIHRPRSCVYGFIKDRSILGNARRHTKHRWLLRVDLEDFFPTINFGRVRGLFLAAPFSFPAPVATMLAQLTTYQNSLPQGAPTSPTLSNYICHRLDYDLISLAARHKCYYTRYADDLNFSANQRTFPSELGILETSGTSLKATVGEELRGVIEAAGFKINTKKVHLKRSNSRQLCTGLVVNAQPNVRREYVKEIRALLHMWRKFGLINAGERFFSRMDRENRVVKPKPETLRYVIQGKLQFLGSIKGWNDPVYLQLASLLVSLDETFHPRNPVPALTMGKIRVYAEGKTDYQHLQSALDYFQSKGRFTELNLDLSLPEPFFEGDAELLKRCKIFATNMSTELILCVFDRDVPDIAAQVCNGSIPFKHWANRVYSVAVPIPKHRANNDRVCIEMYYQDNDLRLADDQGRRLFLREEFNDKGFTYDGKLKMENPKTQKLVVEETIYKLDTQDSVGLAKGAFASNIFNKISPFHSIDFEPFAEIFDVFKEILNEDSQLLT
jgi:RNA-directed DNA polymerase